MKSVCLTSRLHHMKMPFQMRTQEMFYFLRHETYIQRRLIRRHIFLSIFFGFSAFNSPCRYPQSINERTLIVKGQRKFNYYHNLLSDYRIDGSSRRKVSVVTVTDTHLLIWSVGVHTLNSYEIEWVE